MKLFNKMKLYDQGDVLIKSIRSIPSGEQEVVRSKIVAFGEVTGHKHRIEGDSVEVLKILDTLYINAQKAFKIHHEEHNTQVIPAGNYRVDITTEADPFTNLKRQVAD